MKTVHKAKGVYSDITTNEKLLIRWSNFILIYLSEIFDILLVKHHNIL